MKRLTKYIFAIFGILLLFVVSSILIFWWKYNNVVSDKPNIKTSIASPGNYGKYVNTFIGTGGFPAWVCGHNFPGATAPFGGVRLSPETSAIFTGIKGLNNSGYYYGDDKLLGFSHTRLTGTGAQDGGHILFMPTVTPSSNIDFTEDYYHKFSHENEVSFPGYYSVDLKDEEIYCEFTTTKRTGLHRYTFNTSRERNMIINISNALADKRSENGSITIDPLLNEISGSIKTYGSFAGRYGGIQVYFVAKFDTPFPNSGIWDGEKYVEGLNKLESDEIIVTLQFGKAVNDDPIGVKIGISHISIDNARLNLESEVGNKTFENILLEAVNSWEDIFSLIKIEGCTEEQKIIFYSSLYRCFQMPTLFNDINGEYIGFDKNVHQVTDFQYYTDLSLWDTFRTIHPLFNLIARSDQRDMIISLINMAKQGGHLPRWPSGYGYTNSMLGSPADITITEAYLKGIVDFDVDYAFESMKQNALNLLSAGPVKSNRRSIKGYLDYQYCPSDQKHRSVSRTLEYAWADHSISQLAGALNQTKDSILFDSHSKYYKNLWNHETQHFQARNSDGSFDGKFDSLQLTYTDWDDEYTHGYVEGSAHQWRWAVPFDVDGLIKLFKDRDYFVSKLNDFFALSDPQMATWTPGSYYWHGNEPDIHAAYLFNYAERPDLTQKWVRWILENKYDNSYIGIDGNDDAGTLSAWYILSSLGFYPIAGSDIYQLGAPLFERAELNLGNAKLIIIADNYSQENIYVKKVLLNDQELNRKWFRHSEIANGGIIRFVMDEFPHKE